MQPRKGPQSQGAFNKSDSRVLSQGKAPAGARVRKGPQSDGAFNKPDSRVISEGRGGK